MAEVLKRDQENLIEEKYKSPHALKKERVRKRKNNVESPKPISETNLSDENISPEAAIISGKQENPSENPGVSIEQIKADLLKTLDQQVEDINGEIGPENKTEIPTADDQQEAGNLEMPTVEDSQEVPIEEKTPEMPTVDASQEVPVNVTEEIPTIADEQEVVDSSSTQEVEQHFSEETSDNSGAESGNFELSDLPDLPKPLTTDSSLDEIHAEEDRMTSDERDLQARIAKSLESSESGISSEQVQREMLGHLDNSIAEIDREIGMETSKERAIRVLSGPEIMERSPIEVAAFFMAATGGRNLEREADAMVAENLEGTSFKAMNDEELGEYRRNLVSEEREKIITEEHATAVKNFQKRHFGMKPEEAEKKMQETKERLGMPSDESANFAFDRMINQGADLENAKVGWFGKIKIPGRMGMVITFDNKKDMLASFEDSTRGEIYAGAEKRADFKIVENNKKVEMEKMACKKTLIEDVVNKYNLAPEANIQEKIVESKDADTDVETETSKKYVKTRKMFKRTMKDYSRMYMVSRKARSKKMRREAETGIDEMNDILEALSNGDTGPAASKIIEMIDEKQRSIESGEVNRKDLPLVVSELTMLSSRLGELGWVGRLDKHIKKRDRTEAKTVKVNRPLKREAKRKTKSYSPASLN